MKALAFMAAVIRPLRGPVGDLVVAVSGLGIVASSLIGTVAASRGVVELLPAEVMLGSIPEGEDRVVRLTASNRGGEPVEVVVVPSCTCMTLDTAPLTLPPFSNATFPVRVTTARRPGHNVAHVQIARSSGQHLAQSRVTFTTVRGFVFDPPILFARGGDDRILARAYCLARTVPEMLVATALDPAVRATVERTGARTWEIGLVLAGRSRTSLTSVRVVARGPDGDETAGVLTVSLPASRIGNVRVSPIAEPAGDEQARAWMLFDTEARCGMRIVSLRSMTASQPEWTSAYATTTHGSHLWVEVVYPRSAESRVVELLVEVGSLRERMTVTLPRVPGA